MPPLFTIGYEGSAIEEFLERLVDAGVEVVADVRQVTVSRKKGFSKNLLRDHLARVGIQYLHAGQLGDPKPGREAARRGDFVAFERIYNAHFGTDAAQREVRALAAVATSKTTCLMCYEKDPGTCHRRIVANHLKYYALEPIDLFVERSELNATRSNQVSGHHISKSTSAAERRLF